VREMAESGELETFMAGKGVEAQTDA